ncbi:MAG: deoxyguanosinetriphosphate triphosphohydrolase [Chlamydiales bacterium]
MPQIDIKPQQQRLSSLPLEELPYQRDAEVILRSRAFARYSDKTQVVYLVPNDHISQRGLHVQLVSHFSRKLGRKLGLDCDLIECIALGHDVGHPPFGHEGETYLSELSIEYGNGSFAHPWQSCRLLREIESLNLCLAVYDGFLCHDGGMVSYNLAPQKSKTWEDHQLELSIKKEDPEVSLIPMTLEGCLVKICDTLCYLARDLEDAISLKIIDRSEIPQLSLGRGELEILQTIGNDLIRQSLGKTEIRLSPEIFEEIKVLRHFNFERIYFHPSLKKESHKIKKSYRILFKILLEGWNLEGKESYLWRYYLHNKSKQYLEETSSIQTIVDFISGMTDHYFLRTLENLILPRDITL